MPRSREKWETISNGFRNRWVFPPCCGAIDGKHVLINAPDEGRSRWVFQNSSLLELLENGRFLVGDDTFPLKPYLMKAYKNFNRPLTQEESIFNYRLSRARRIIENVFGILLSGFRFLDRKLAVKLLPVLFTVGWLLLRRQPIFLQAPLMKVMKPLK